MRQIERAVATGSSEVKSSDASNKDLRRWVPDLLGIAWVIAAGLAVLLPTLTKGVHLGSFDLLSQVGLSKRSGIAVHNIDLGDQIDAIMPWSSLAWTQVHHGQLPLWNPYSGLGMPLAFNWQSAPLGLPALVGYLFPIQYAYTVGVIVTMVVAGTGAYFLGRVLRLGIIGSVMAGVVFELSGPFIQWLGWPHAVVISWSGWLFAAALLIIRGGNRLRNIVFFSFVLASSVYAGQPEIFILLLFYLSVFLLVLLIQNAQKNGTRSVGRPIVDLAIAFIAGGALAAPLVLPGLQYVSGSIHSTLNTSAALPVRDLPYLFFQGFDGLPLPGQSISLHFYIGAYVGVIALVCAVVAVAMRRHKPEIVAFAFIAILSGAMVFIPELESLMSRLPVVESVIWNRSLLPMAFVLAILAGVGIDALVHSKRERMWRWTGVGFALFGFVLLVLLFSIPSNFTPHDRSIREKSFVWPVVETVVGLGVVAALVHRNRRRDEDANGAELKVSGTGLASSNKRTVRGGAILTVGRVRLGPGQVAGLVLLACESAFLIAAGAPWFSSSNEFYTRTAAEATLQRIVGTSTVAVGGRVSKSLPGYECLPDAYSVGILPDVNVVYGLHDFDVYDPATPAAYYNTWTSLTGQLGGNPFYSNFCPLVNTSSEARRYGVQFVIEQRGAPPPKGSKYVTTLADENIFRIPGAAVATLTPIRHNAVPPDSASGRAVAVTHPDPASWRIVTDSATPQLLRLRLSDVPGWHASIDGRPLELSTFSGVMLQARVPGGRHVVELHYWPDTFTVGLVLAACSLLGFLGAYTVTQVQRRKKESPSIRP
jgi:hypothetical protein